MVKYILFILVILSLSACVEMRDYVGAREGFFGLDVKTRFGEGAERKDYYVTEDGVGIVQHDSKNEIISKMGSPDSIETTLEGYECWIYEEDRLQLIFKGDYLHDWIK
ncbi:MAG: hypothetical protein JSW40_04285 [Candidatus Omnitrophota bacterium]|nr:MAG: hypothetical protein JSW40_04285 [Candidatus Omnitrophota bacterium]